MTRLRLPFLSGRMVEIPFRPEPALLVVFTLRVVKVRMIKKWVTTGSGTGRILDVPRGLGVYQDRQEIGTAGTEEVVRFQLPDKPDWTTDLSTYAEKLWVG